ncbi:MAG: hypothetical protein GF392_03030 [Candidatus Omnitrophica bacterium]|nr:hypothetical protein [Candidatus Omnitrophota bacterium]
MKRISAILAVLLFLRPAVCPAQASGQADYPGTRLEKSVYLCCEERDWYPFLVSEGREVYGILVDIVREAFSRVGYKIRVEPFPMNRCLKLAQHARSDGIVGMPYSREYARYVEYPPDSADKDESRWRIMQIDQVVVTYEDRDGQYEFDGNIRSLPEPVRISTYDPLASDITQAGLDVEEAASDRQNFAKLVRDRRGSVITTSLIAENILRENLYKDILHIHAVPVRSRSFFLAFSWDSSLSDFERQRIWQEIASVREDYVFMLQLFARY